MLEKEQTIKVEVTTLRKKIAEQIPIRYDVPKEELDDCEIVGWIFSSTIGHRNGTGIDILLRGENDFFWTTGNTHRDGLRSIGGRIAETHIYIS